MHSAQTRRARTGSRTVASGRYPGHHKGVLPASTTELEVRAGVFRQPAMQTPVLVLNASYEPINICGARRALVLVLKGVARTEEEQGRDAARADNDGKDAERDPAAGVPEDSAPDAGAFTQKHPAARPQHVPVLPGGADGE